MKQPKNILFIHEAYPSQFTALHDYYRRTGEAVSYQLMNEEGRRWLQYNADFSQGTMSYFTDGIVNYQGYYFSGSSEKLARNSINVLDAVHRIIANHKIDVIVAHAGLGYPILLFDNVPVPIITYFEFPNHASYGWDARYPAHPGQLHVSTFDEAYSWQYAIKSAVNIVPSEYARSLFPPLLQDKIVVQMDGLDIKAGTYEPQKAAFIKDPNLTYVGFFSRALSSEKGLGHFIEVTNRLCKECPDMRFVLMGAPMGQPSYGYERQFLDNNGHTDKSFLQYLFEKYDVDTSKYILTGHMSTEVFSSTIYHVDMFLYPLLHGMANWGIFELLARGRIVIASDRCFIPEIITHGVNGFMLSIDAQDAWCDLIKDVAQNKERYTHIGENAKEVVKRCNIANAAKRYLEIIDQYT